MDILPVRLRRFPKLAALGIAIATASLFIVSSVGTAGAAGAPTNVVATPTDTSVLVAFTPDPTDLAGATYTATCTSGNGGATASNSAPSPITVTGLSRGKTYSCKVTATDSGGSTDSAPSTSFAVPTVAPSAPTVGQVTANGTTASVPYTGSSDDGGAPPLTYSASCSSTGGATGNGSGASPISVPGLSRGQTYTCTVTARNADNQSTTSVQSNTFAIATTAPSAPTIGTVTLSGTTASVPYTPSADDGGAAVSYSASCSTAAPGATGTGSGGSPISVSGLTPGFAYTCKVTASNGTGSATSAASNSVTVAPPAPTIGTPVAGNTQIGVAFTPIASSPPATYTASCASSNGGTPGTLPGQSASPITVTGLTNGRTYQCTVTATVNGLTSPASAPSAPVIPLAAVPGQPTITAVARHDGSVTVTFAAPTDPGFSPVTSYSVSCPSTTGGAAGSQTGTVSPITVAALTNGATYTCTVTAHNAAGAGAPSALSATFVPATVPGAPGGVVAKPRDSSAIVSWSAPGNGGSAITAYLITYTPGDKTVTVGGSTTTTTITGLHNGNAYSFTVQARNDVGTGPASAEAGPVTPNLLDVNGEVIAAAPNGYWFVTADGKVASFGEAKNFGGLTRIPNAFVVGLEPTPTMKGYWLVASDGGIFSFGDASFRGSTGNLKLNKPIIGMASTASGKGYWLVASDGGIFAFGDAKFYGSTGAIRLNQPIVGMTSTPSGDGYWLVASDGGIFAFGDAKFYGSAGGIKLNQPIVAMDHTPSGRGYWMVATDGGVFSFGPEARFYGSTGAIHLNRPIIGLSATPTGKGYWFVAADAGLFSFGDAPFYGPALGAQSFFVAHPVTAMNASRAGG